MILPIIQYPNPILGMKSAPIMRVDDSVKSLAINLMETAAAEKGLGISAIQCGIPKQLIVVSEDAENYTVMINPVILEQEGFSTTAEYCLSYMKPTKVTRAKRIVVRYMDLEGNWRQLEASGLLAICILHEADHALNGKGIWDYEVK